MCLSVCLPYQSVMAALQIFVLLTLLGVCCSQLYNGYINPLFLPRGLRGDLRGGRFYDPYTDARDDRYYLSRGGAFQDDDYRRRGFDPRYDDYYRRNVNQYDDYRRYPNGFDRRYNDVYRQYPDDYRYQSSVGLATTARPLDRGQILDRGQFLDRGQILSTSSPDLSVTVQPNGLSR